MKFDKGSKEESYFLGTGGRFLFTGQGVSDQWGPNDFLVKPQGSLGYFIIATAYNWCSIYVMPGSQNYVWYHPCGSEKLLKLFRSTN